MMDLIQRFFTREKNNRGEIRKNFSEFFFSQAEHQWIIAADCRVHFEKLISILPSSLLETLMTKYPVTFIPSENLRKHGPGQVLSNTIVIFPEFQKLINSHKAGAIAYLAHELAFVLWELEGHKGEPLMAEVAADKFVCDLGLTLELEDFLLMLDESIEKRLRLTYVTINYFTNNN